MENKDDWSDFGEVKKQDVNTVSLVAILLALFLPPLGVALKCGIGSSFIINIILTFFFWFPGVIHAFFVILNED